jgi:hypothetical protein
LVAGLLQTTLVVLAEPASVAVLDSLELELRLEADLRALTHPVAWSWFNHVDFEDSASKLLEERLD